MITDKPIRRKPTATGASKGLGAILSMPDVRGRANASIAEYYAVGNNTQRKAIRNALLPGATSAEFARWILKRMPWRFFARPDQMEPLGLWRFWLFSAGRGAGKTRTGAEWTFEKAVMGRDRMLGVTSPTTDDHTRVTFDGPSGLMRIVERHRSVVANVTTRPWRIDFKNGSRIQSFTAEAVERLRGPNHHFMWVDELAAMGKKAQEVMDQASFGLRLGDNPRMLITTTPKPIPTVRKLVDRVLKGDPTVVMTAATMMDNAANLAQSAIDELRAAYEGTRLGRQELMGELLLDVPGALFPPECIARASLPPRFDRIVVAVDPSGASDSNSNSDEIGIVVVGVVFGREPGSHRYYVLQDATMIGGPSDWAAKVCDVFDAWDADAVVAETNFGGGMVEATLRRAPGGASMPVKCITASRGKHIRAEPISLLYEQGRVFHCGIFAALEDQLAQFTPSGYLGDRSPDRADALIHGISELSGGPAVPRVVPLDATSPSYWRPS